MALLINRVVHHAVAGRHESETKEPWSRRKREALALLQDRHRETQRERDHFAATKLWHRAATNTAEGGVVTRGSLVRLHESLTDRPAKAVLGSHQPCRMARASCFPAFGAMTLANVADLAINLELGASAQATPLDTRVGSSQLLMVVADPTSPEPIARAVASRRLE